MLDATYKGFSIVFAERSGVEIALAIFTAQGEQDVLVFNFFHAFGHNFQPQGMGPD